MQTTDEGTYLEVDGRPAVRFERIYPQSVERVWQAISEPAEIDRRHVVAGGDAHAQVAAPFDGSDSADVGDDAGEHGPPNQFRTRW